MEAYRFFIRFGGYSMRSYVCSVCFDAFPFGRRWPKLEWLETMVAFELAGSYRRATTVLGVTHSVVRQRLRSLDRQLGVALVEAQTSVLTSAGLLVAGQSRELLARMARWARR